MIGKKKLIALGLFSLLATSSIISLASTQNENDTNKNPQSDVTDVVQKNAENEEKVANKNAKKEESKSSNEEKISNDSISSDNKDVVKNENQNLENENIKIDIKVDKEKNIKKEIVNNNIQEVEKSENSNDIKIQTFQEQDKQSGQATTTTDKMLNIAEYKDFIIENNKLIKYVGKEKYVLVPNFVEIIGEGAFKDNAYVEQLILPDSLKYAESQAFAYMQNLKLIEKSSQFWTDKEDIYDGSNNLQDFIVRSDGR